MSRNPGTPSGSPSTPRTPRTPRTSRSPGTPLGPRRDASRSPVRSGPGASGSSSSSDPGRYNYFKGLKALVENIIIEVYDRYEGFRAPGDPTLMWALYYNHDEMDALTQTALKWFEDKYFPSREQESEAAYSPDEWIARLKDFGKNDFRRLIDPLVDRMNFLLEFNDDYGIVSILQEDLDVGDECKICHIHIRDEDKNEDDLEEDAWWAKERPERKRYIVGSCEGKKHRFHSTCLYDALNTKKQCPFCQRPVKDFRVILDKLYALDDDVTNRNAGLLRMLGSIGVGLRECPKETIGFLKQSEEIVRKAAEELRQSKLRDEQRAARIKKLMDQFYDSVGVIMD